MDLRQFLIAPHERVQQQSSRHGTSQFDANPEHQQHGHQGLQSQQLQHQNHAPQHHQQSQSLHHTMNLPHQHPRNTATPPLTRDQVLQGLAAYPDILAFVMQSQELNQSHGQRSNEDKDRGFGYQTSHTKSSLLSSSHYAFAGKERLGQDIPSQEQQSKQRWATKSESRISPTTSNAAISMIPTSPRAGRYAKGQRLHRQGQYQQHIHAQGQQKQYSNSARGQTYRSLSNVTDAVSVPAPFTLKRKASSLTLSSNSLTSTLISSSALSAGNTPIRDADTPSFPNKKARELVMTDKQRSNDGTSEQPSKSTESFMSCAQGVDGLDGESDRDFNGESNEDCDRHSTGDADRESDHRHSAKQNLIAHAVRASVRDSTRDAAKETKSTDLTQVSNDKSNITKDSTNNHTTNQNAEKKAAKQARQTQQTQRKALAAAKPLDVIPYTTSLQHSTPGVKASELHNKIHATCFLWYHGLCPKKKGKYCKYLHDLTSPPSYVQPPRWYVHGGHGEEGQKCCKRDWCPGDWMWDHDFNHGDDGEEDAKQEARGEVGEGEVNEDEEA